MRIQLQQIPPEGLKRSELLPVEWADSALEGEATVVAPGVDVQVRLQRVGREILLEGEIRATMAYACDRCLEQAQQVVEAPFTLLVGPPREKDLQEEEEVELEEDDLSYLPLTGQEIVLDEVIREQLILAIPMVRRCSEECRGLCPGCGRNLNQEACTCSASPVDPRWEALKKFKD